MKRNLKKYYPKDKTFCMYSDECGKICPRKISDYELKLLNYEVAWEDFRYSTDCQLKMGEG